MNMKRLLSLLLAFVLVLGMFPAPALAAEGGEVSTVDVVLSLSADDCFMVGPGSDAIMAMQDITVPYFDLALYGLEEYYFVSESYGDDGDGLPGSDLQPGTPEYAYGKVTLLHLYIYAIEVFYCGIDPQEAGQGYLYNEGYIGTEVFTISGGVGSSFLNQFWGGDCNLNYYVNYEYPLASEGWGATSDQILLRDGDIITLGHFTGWSFYGDSYSIFNYIVADDQNPVRGEEITLTLYYAGANLGFTDGTAQNLNPYCLDVYYAPYDDIPSECVTDWEYLGTADENGELTVDTSELEAGEYIIAVAGQYGVDFPDDICSTPGGVRIVVEEPAHEHSYEAEVTAPSCTEGGYTTYTCGCGDSYTADETDALGHDFADGTCTRCGEADPAYPVPFTYEINDTPSNGNNWAKLGKGTISGEAGGVVKHIWGSGSLTVLLTANTPDDAVITSSFSVSGMKPTLSGTGSVTLVNGTARQTVTLKSPFGTVATWTVLYTKDSAPVLAEGQSAAASGETGVNEGYVVDLNGIFADPDGDALTYQVSVDGGAYEAFEGSTYTYIPTVPGEHTLVFRANDGVLNSDDTYTVTINAKNSSVTYDVTVTAPEGVSFYAVGEVEGGQAVKGDALVCENGVVRVPENISRIAWEAEGMVGMSAPVSAGMSLELVAVTFDVKLHDGDSDAAAAVEIVDAQGVTVSGTAADTYLLPALAGFSYKATPSVSGYNAAQLTEQTPAAGQVSVTLSLKHFTVIAPANSVVSAGTLSGSFSYSFATPISVENADDTVVYKFAPLSGAAFIRVQNPDDDAVTYWDFKSSKADGQTITVTEAMLFMNDAGTEGEFNSNTVYRNFEYYSFDLGDIYMNINNQGYINMDVGAVKDLNMFRNWQAINSYTNDKIAVPDFEYEIINIEGENVLSIVPDANNSGAAVMTATGEGTAIVLVTYDAMYSELTATGTLGGEGGGNRLSAIWPDRTGVFVVSVGKDGTGIKSNMTCNGAVFDAEHSPQFYHGDEGASVSFTPDEGVTVTVNRSTVGEKKLSFGEFTSEGVSVNAETGEVTVSGLTTGRHIIRLEKDGVASYQVVTATKTTVTMTDSEGNELSLEEKLQPGQTVKLTVTGLTSPAEKFATKYNFNCQITYKDQLGNAYSNSSGATYGKYDFSSIPQVVTVTIPEDWTEQTLTLNGFMKMGGFAGDGIGSHRKVSYGENRGMAWGSDAGMELGTLPEIVLNVAVKPEQYVPDENDVPVYQGNTWPSADGYIAEIGVKDAKGIVGHSWSENYGSNTVAVYVLLDASKYEDNTTFSTYYLTGGENPPEVEAWGEDENGNDLLTLDITMSNNTTEWWNSMNTMYYMIGSKYVGATFVPAVYSLNKSELTMEVGASDKLTASLTYYSGSSAWESSNPDVVSVDDAGNITAVASGTASITASVGNFTATCVITVEEPCSHDWTEATCTTPKTCSKCGETEGEALGHSYEAVVTAPTCTEGGYTTYTCSGCGDSYIADETAALGHSEEIIPAVDATCTGTGLTEGRKCSVCGEVTVAQEIVDALGHDFADGSCTRCGEADPDFVTVLAEGWSGYTTWVLTSDGCLTFTSSGETLPNGESNMKNYWKVGGVLTLPWGAYAEQITKVVINEGIHDIGQMAFYEMPNLVEVVLPESAVEIREYTFKNCAKLTTINLEVVEFIREGAFYGCSALENVTFAEGVVIGDWAFSRTNITLP